MSDWREYETESTENLIEFIRWKSQADYAENAKLAFQAFCFRFRDDIIKKAEIHCKKWGHDKDVAKEVAKRVFKRFLHSPNYDHSKSSALDYNEGVTYYLYGFIPSQLIEYYREQRGYYASPYTGYEDIVWELPPIPEDIPVEAKRVIKKKYEIIEKALGRLSEKHKPIYLTYKEHQLEGNKMPRPLLKKLREALGLTQQTVQYYKFEAEQKMAEYIEIYG